MRSVLARGLVPFGSWLLVSALAASANADPSAASVISRGGAPWIRVGGASATVAGSDAVTRGRSILASQLAGKVPTLVTSGVDRFGDGETIVRFGQTHEGLPVIGRGASVRLGRSGQAVATVVDLEADLPTSGPRLSPQGAADVAAARTIFRATANESHLVVWPTLDRGARLAYAVLPRLPAGVPSQPRVIVDAETGEVLQARDMVTFAAQANMYEFNPTKTPTLALRDLTLAPGATLTNEFLESLNCVDKKSVRSINVGFALDVHVCDIAQVAAANESGNFVYEPSDVPGSVESRTDPFSEVSIYYHSAKAYAFFRDLQGDPTAQVVSDKPLRLVANLQIPAGLMSGNTAQAGDPDTALEPFQNAFFSPAAGGLGGIFQELYGINSGALWFGQGPKRDFSYDGDVVYHEFGHAVVDDTIKLESWHVDAFGAVDAPGAMNEGLADYFSSAITGDPNVGEYAAADIGDGVVIRTLENSDKCPSSVAGEVHYDSTLFSGGLWQARQSLPEGDRSKFDAGIYKALRANPGQGDLGYGDLVQLFLSTLKTDFPSGAQALETSMTERGVLPACDRVYTYDGKPIESPYRRMGFASPGKQSVSVKGVAPGIIQVRATIPAKTASIKVSFSASSSGGGNPLAGSSDSFTPVVLAKFGTAISWDPKSKTGHDATLKADTTDDSGSMEATLTLPEDSTETTIYLQIANTGTSDGTYDSIDLTFNPLKPAVDEPAPPVESPPATATTTSGCAAAASSGTTSALGSVGLALAALVAVRRRSRKR